MIEFKRNKNTGILEAYENGVLLGAMHTLGDGIMNEHVEQEQVRDIGNMSQRDSEQASNAK